MNFCVGASASALAQAKSLARSHAPVHGGALIPVVEAIAEIVAGTERASGTAQLAVAVLQRLSRIYSLIGSCRGEVPSSPCDWQSLCRRQHVEILK